MKNRTCSAPGCTTKHYCKGYCTKHYSRLMTRGSIEDRPVLTTSEMLDARTDKTGDCWMWTGSIQTTGYGAITINKVRKYAHRVAYEVSNGPIPEGMRIDHICHTPLCVKPAHLRVVTIKQNAENFSGLNATNKSGYRGVYWHAQFGKWCVQVTHNGRRYAGGLYAKAEEANAAAIALRNKLHTHNELDRAA